MPRSEIVYAGGVTGVAPASVSVPDGYDAATVLASTGTTLPWEAGYARRRWRTFQRLSGSFTFTFPDALDAPATLLRALDQVHVFVEGRGAVDRITFQVAGGARHLYGQAPETLPRVRSRTIVSNVFEDPAESLSVTVSFEGVRVAAVRATLMVLQPMT